MADLLSRLGQLLSHGVAMTSALQAVEADTERETLKELVQLMRRTAAHGRSLASCLQRVSLFTETALAAVRPRAQETGT